ncbi:hypothetical protein G7070_11540 [Propioniciclava coleopterorum]|uniref:Bacterial archaeo-eukaryotic release factor family 8 domain-containing protein n=1 Tax=Propioniciclava coleopterorum TaxID=2714937 RepID=A0A6G7Y7U8_9ACTN|nr:hypothetical protein [Propioniciclava coleopterorum]QIK72789.1 hypothetical protein G7070_11540 [Propioniciclava coleopterorum]
MPTRYRLPDLDDLTRLGKPHERALTIYAPTDPADRPASRLALKSAVDDALRQVRETGVRPAVEDALRAQWDAFAASDVWSELAGSIALFLAEDGYEAYVLPNILQPQVQVGTRYDIGQLVRAVTTPQEAYALTLSADGWNLWHATATTRAVELEIERTGIADVAEATNRATVRDRDHVRRLVGDEGLKVLLSTYIRRVSDAVTAELRGVDRDIPLFLFAAQPLLDLYRNAHASGHPLVTVQGSPDALAGHEIDEAIRVRLPGHNAAQVDALATRLMDGTSGGLVAHDLADIARATASGAVSTMVYDFTAEIRGSLDTASGAIAYDKDGYDLSSMIVVQVLAQGGDVFAVRPGEITAPGWNGTAMAGLRFPLA